MSRVPSPLLKMSLFKVVAHLYLYSDRNYEALHFLPMNLKNRILKRFMIRRYLWKKVDFAAVLAALLNKETNSINLSLARLDNQILTSLEKGCRLTSLHLVGSDRSSVSTERLVNLLSQLHMLTNLILMNCHAVDDSVINCIANNCPRLAAIDVTGCENVTNVGVVKLAKLKNLSCIRLSSTQVTDEGIRELVKRGGERIKELGMHDCVHVTQDALDAISHYCPNLEVLSLYGTGYHGDLASFEANFKNSKLLMWSITL